MLQNVKDYQDFLKNQIKERELFLEVVSPRIVYGLTEYLKGWGWRRTDKNGGLKGDKIKGVKYTKNYNGKDYTIEYRNNLRLDSNGLYYENGFNEFIHDKSIGTPLETLHMTTFYWNDENVYGNNKLDNVLRSMDEYYSRL